ncbi:hypothetical protein HELRODRAFT_167297 [Helobdella robusta]|uniref:Uncharacterized protein n=1 Tax=Helobdella robusta TaxID=6412 RepID=T1EZ83_HELRO|nr:hypothetical protein HELRODRAFT_167297 [Helobdella robusta]ESO10798.1 hypothetical protein HELRODRAFT_167297 [Helobdella robusta]
MFYKILNRICFFAVVMIVILYISNYTLFEENGKKINIEFFDQPEDKSDYRVNVIKSRENMSSNEILFGFLRPKSLEGLLGEVKVVSMSLYGSQPRYVGGALKNAELVKKNFPGWTLRIYVDSSNSSKYEAVPSNVLKELEGLGVDVHRVENDELSVPPMMWRFLVADDPTVDRFIIRDSDSRLTERDYKGVQAWMASRQAFHCVRDHPTHAQHAISRGLWGARKIWPRVSKHAYCSDSVSCDIYPNSFPFPVPRPLTPNIQAWDDRDVGNSDDINVLKPVGENKNCTQPMTRVNF